MPGLLTLKTDLKSLKYGQDQPGGGDSGQPYIKTDINDVDRGFTRFRLTKFDDGLIRGGIIGATNASVVDTLRIGKFFIDFPKGPLFLVKQVGLQLSNPRLEVPKNPFNIAQGAPDNLLSVGTNGLLQPTRIYNLGINTLAQVPINSIGGHIVRHGLLPVQNKDSKYEAIVTANNENSEFNPLGNNRLVGLAKKFKLGDKQTDATQDNNIIRRVNTTLNILNTVSSIFGGPNIPLLNTDPEQLIINKYFGGPGSVYGLGNTTINRYSFTEDGFKIKFAFDQSRNFAGYTRNDKNEPEDINYANTLGVSKQYFSGSREIQKYNGINIDNPTQKPSNLDLATYNNVPKIDIPLGTVLKRTNGISVKNSSYSEYKKIIESRKLTETHYISGSNPVNQFGIYGNNGSIIGSEEILPDATTYPIYYNGNKKISLKLPWNEITREKRIGSGLKDSINLTPIFSSGSYWYNDSVNIKGVNYNIRDLVKFTIQSIDTESPDTSDFMVFRAYLTQLSDNVDAKWSDINYVGRGNPFYIYSGFTRKVQINFKVAALSAEEMQPMYSKLNNLMASLMPDYGSGNVMRGPLHRMTIGNYFDAQLGILNSISYTIPNDSPWEIAIDEPEGGTQLLILPHIIEVSMNFTPIGAETKRNNKIEAKSKDTSFLAQNSTGRDADKIQYYNDFFNK